MNNKYNNTKIYKLVHIPSGYFYIGSTTQLLCKRYTEHKSRSKTNRLPCYVKLNELGWDDIKIILIENISCASKEEQLKHENKYIMENINNAFCLNCKCAVLDREKRKNTMDRWIRNNKESLAEHQKEYYQTKRIQVLEKMKNEYQEKNREKYVCVCGSLINPTSINKHVESKKHTNFVNDK